MQHIELTSVDGARLEAALHRTSDSVARGTLLQVHGITVDMDEGSMFVRLADRAAESGFDVLRFSMRGHGASGGTQQGVTIAGECLDLQAAVAYARGNLPCPLSIVAASFGAVPTVLSVPWIPDLHRLVLWNPVLDLRATFLEPTLKWGLQNFDHIQQKRLADNGFLLVDGDFQLGRVMFTEFNNYRPLDDFMASSVPTLIVHGDHDESVSYNIAADAARTRPNTVLHTVVGSDHGWDSPEREQEAISVTSDWLAKQSLRDVRR